jgi:predicted nucleotidyltransferase
MIDALVDAVVDRIAKEVSPRRVILFGSRARGNARPDSDIDLLLICDNCGNKRELKRQVRRLFPLPTFGMDLFILTTGEYERQRHIPATVGRAAELEGVVCYER